VRKVAGWLLAPTTIMWGEIPEFVKVSRSMHLEQIQLGVINSSHGPTCLLSATLQNQSETPAIRIRIKITAESGDRSIEFFSPLLTIPAGGKSYLSIPCAPGSKPIEPSDVYAEITLSDGPSISPDLTPEEYARQVQLRQARIAAEQAAQDKEEIEKAAMEASERKAAEQAQTKKLEALRRKREAERIKQDARMVELRQEKERLNESLRRQEKAICASIRKATIDRKVSDLTVRETQQVKACQALGVY